ncbi:carbohydrate esterase family 5 protein [Auriculariales sp. MPI-PUGE-AT-0066]|nr:carbohydrate esterase family 5 protein [Auriculariales sp. MPI-PUGE-AT-0066]
MKTAVIATVVASSALVSAAPASRRWLNYDVAHDMQDVIDGEIFADCKAIGVIFAKGTFDSKDIGVWVGPQFRDALEQRISSVAFQGVNPDDYPADLSGYLAENGCSESGARSLAKTVTEYVDNCKDTTIIISGWSQGACVAHKGLSYLTPTVQAKVAGLVTFGDPWQLFSNESVPANIPYHGECLKGTALDPLCASIPSDFVWPSSIDDILGPFSELPGLVVGVDEAKAAASLALHFPGQLLKASSAFFDALTDKKKMQRLLLSPQHFMYGNKGLTSTAADFVAALPQVQGK